MVMSRAVTKLAKPRAQCCDRLGQPRGAAVTLRKDGKINDGIWQFEWDYTIINQYEFHTTMNINDGIWQFDGYC